MIEVKTPGSAGIYESQAIKSAGTNVIQTDSQSIVAVFVRVDEDADWIKTESIKAGDVLTELNFYPGMLIKFSSTKPFRFGYL